LPTENISYPYLFRTYQQGKLRYIAASNLSPERLAASFEASERNGLARYVALQPHYNLVEKYALTVFPYYSLAAGFLTGKYRGEADLGKSVRGESLRLPRSSLMLRIWPHWMRQADSR